MPDLTAPPTTRSRKPPGYWQVWDNLAQELTAFMLEWGEPGFMPSKTILTRAGRSDLINAIRTFGGQEAVADRLGLTTRQHPAGYWHDFSRVEEALRIFLVHHGETGVTPTDEELTTSGRADLANAVNKHGGLLVVADKLGWQTGQGQHRFSE